MRYSWQPSHCRVDFFKPSGKWYATHTVDFHGEYHTPLIHNAFRNALAKHFNGKICMAGMQAVCLKPHHMHSHPISVIIPEE